MILLTLIVGLTIHGALHAADTQLVELTGADKLLYDAVKMVVVYWDLPAQFKLIEYALDQGANVKVVQTKFPSYHDPLMCNMVAFGKKDLLRRLLETGANVAVNVFGDPLLRSVERVSIARLLLQHGAHMHLSDQQKLGVLALSMCSHRKIGLIDLYKSYGFDVTLCDSKWGGSLLMTLADRPYEKSVTKALALLKDLTDEQRVALIKARDIKGKDVFDFIETRWRAFRSLTYLEDCKNLKDYEIFLKEQLLAAQDVRACAICCDDVTAESLTVIKCCEGLFHKECLETWSTSTCPYCRGNYVTGVPEEIPND